MINDLDNPFSVTKATEFSDSEILAYWVNFNAKENVSIETILNPNEYLPKYVIGGKGCGKTHILRYFSYSLQKLRNNNSVIDVLEKYKYIGLYSVFGGLNSSRFSGKNVDDSQWQSIFEYYFELYICDNLLRTVREVVISLESPLSIEALLVQNILSIFSNFKEVTNVSTFSDLIEYFNDLRRKIDLQIQNAAFTRQLDFESIKILFSPGDLIFGIPDSISNNHPNFKDVKFIYIFDEYEKLYEWQKKFVNTLVWDKKTPVTFWIGARRYGFTTRRTKTGEEMKSGSEFQDVNLDEIIRSNEDLYKEFADKLYTNRLVKFYESRNISTSPEEASKMFRERFENYDQSKIINSIIKKNINKEYEHLSKFRQKLNSYIQTYLLDTSLNGKSVEGLIEGIKANTENDPLEQKYKLFRFYYLWHKVDRLTPLEDILNRVNSEYDSYKVSKQNDNPFIEIKDKRKKDLIAQLTKENNIKNTEYSGIENFIQLSQGNARSFIIILKKTIEYSKIRGERPLDYDGRISLDSQYLAVYDTSKWFYEDAELTGELGKQVYISLKNLTDYFIQERFCDKPIETTVSQFYVKAEALSIEAYDCIELMKMHSFIIERDNGRLAKTSGRKERLFQINKILAPLWNLPTVIRGSISLNDEIAEAIFNFNCHSSFEKLYKKRKAQLNAPDFLKYSSKKPRNTESQNTLF